MDTSSYVKIPCITSAIFYSHNIRYTNYMKERHSEKLTVAQLVKKFPAFYGTQRRTMSGASWIQSTFS